MENTRHADGVVLIFPVVRLFATQTFQAIEQPLALQLDFGGANG
jgi:hypothetical protein